MASLSLRAVKAQCRTLADELLRTGAASAEAITGVRPGGSENPARDGAAWLRFYGQLQLFRGRSQSPAAERARQGEDNPGDDSMTLAALAGAPTVVRIAGVDRAVYPKSLAALLHCHGRDVVLGKLAALLARLKDADANDEHADLVAESVDEIEYHTGVCAWIALTEGPGLPFPKHDRRPAIPDDIATLGAIGFLEINRAFARVNWVNLRAMQSLLEPEDDDGEPNRARPSWSVFFGSLAIELHEDPMTLIENRALVSVMASTSLAASSRRAAMHDAKAKAEAERTH